MLAPILILLLPARLLPAHMGAAGNTDARIARAERALASDPQNADSYSELAAAYLQKLRESGDFDYVNRAAGIIDQALSRDPGNYEALRLANEVDLNWHRFSKV